MSEQVPPNDGTEPNQEWSPDELADVGDWQGYVPVDDQPAQLLPPLPPPNVPPGPQAAGPFSPAPPQPAPGWTGGDKTPADAGHAWGVPGQLPPPEWGGPTPPPPPQRPTTPAGWVPNAPQSLYAQSAEQPGVVPLRPLRLGEIIEGCFRTFRRYPGAVWTVGLILAGIQALLYVGLFALLSRSHILDVVGKLDPNNTASWPRHWDQYSQVPLSYFGAWLILALIVSVTTYVIGSLVFSHVGGEAVLGTPMSASEAWRLSRRQFGRGIGVWVMVFLAIFGVAAVGILATGAVLLIPGVGPFLALALYFVTLAAVIFFGIRFFLAPTVLALEDVGASTAISRSFRLVRGSGWRVFGYILVATLIVGALSIAVSLPFNVIGGLGSAATSSPTTTGNAFSTVSTFGLFMQLIGNLISTAVTIPFLYLFGTLLYTDLRMRKENLAPVLSASARQRRS